MSNIQTYLYNHPSLANWIGFDDVFEQFDRAVSQAVKIAPYPPYNTKKIGDNKYLIELAVAGFKKDQIEITLDGNQLKVAGKNSDNEKDVNYIHRGLATRSFVRTFPLAEHVVVNGADLTDGILAIELELVLPDEKKPRKIEIGAPKLNTVKQELLQE